MRKANHTNKGLRNLNRQKDVRKIFLELKIKINDDPALALPAGRRKTLRYIIIRLIQV